MNLRALDWKKIGFIALFLLAAIFFAYLLYLFFFAPAVVKQPAQSGESQGTGSGLNLSDEDFTLTPADESGGALLSPNGGQPASDTAQGSLTRVNTLYGSPTSGVSLAANGTDLIYYDTITSRFRRVTPDGKTTDFVDQKFFNLDRVAYAPSKISAIIEYPDGANVAYNFTTNSQVTLPAHWEQFTFAKRSDTVAFKSFGLNAENNFLAIANADGTGAKIIEPLGNNGNKVILDWSPNDSVVGMFVNSGTSSTSGEQHEVFFIGKNHENLKSIIVEGYGFESQWSKNGDRLLYSVHSGDSDFIPELWVTFSDGAATGTGRKNLGLQTWAHKCSFGSNEVAYCAVPQEMKEGYGFFPEKANQTPDSFYKVNLKNGTNSLLAVPDGEYTAMQVSVSDDGKYLYFTDVNTGKIHKITL